MTIPIAILKLISGWEYLFLREITKILTFTNVLIRR